MLRSRVGGHDGAGRLDPARGRETRGGLAQPVHDLRHGQRYADDAGREHERGAGGEGRRLLGGLGHGSGRGEPVGSRAGVGDARVHRDGPDAARPLGEQIGVVHHRRRAHGVPGKDAGGGAARRGHEQGDVGRAVGFEPGVGRRGGEAAR